MSGRHNDYKGSSRSARDDSRPHSARERSRSPRRRNSPPVSSRRQSPPTAPLPPKTDDLEKYRDLQQRDHKDDKDSRKSPDGWESSDEEVPAPPPPPRISKISMGFSKAKAPIKMNIGGPAKSAAPKPTVASVFGADDDDEPEEMPAEAKMRMRNIGRETPTSAGPNSFGKTKQGFCDAKKVFEKNLKHALETVEGRKTIPKFPQTIYKINEGAN